MYLYDKSFSTLAYPLLVWLLCVFVAMIINLLMWPDVRTPRGQQENNDSAV